MTQTIPKQMRAVVLDEFGGPDNLKPRTLPVPEVGPGEVLIRVQIAGVGEWDPFEREGGYAQMLGIEPDFPYVLGSEGAGAVAACGEGVEDFQVGDLVYAPAFLNPRGGFYAEYAVVPKDLVFRIPDAMDSRQAGVMSGVGLTALRGLEDTLHLKRGETVMIFGASGGIGHIAVQIANRMGARVFAVASGEDGVALVKRLGVDAVVDGHKDDVLAAAQAFAPDGLDAALLTAGGEAAEQGLRGLRSGGRAAYPFGVQPEPQARPDVQVTGYNGEPDADIMGRFQMLVAVDPIYAHVAQTFPLEQAAEAHRALDTHYLGKIALRVDGNSGRQSAGGLP